MSELIEQVEEFAKPFCIDNETDPTLWEQHTRLVREYAVKIAKIEGVDEELLEISALLHDIGTAAGRDDHAERGAQWSQAFLEDLGLPQEKIELIVECVRKHGTQWIGTTDKLEVKVIQAADGVALFFDEILLERKQKQLGEEKFLRKIDAWFTKACTLDSGKKLAETRYKELIANFK